MAKEDILKLIEKLKSEPGLLDRLKAINHYEAFMDVIAVEGFDIGVEEFKEYAASIAQNEKLSDSELSGVTGGNLRTSFGWLYTTVGFGCGYWEANDKGWMAISGCCGSCKKWWYGNLLAYLGLPGECHEGRM
jgi:predicted ribosomally synthesized peptide with nif11-like leader